MYYQYIEYFDNEHLFVNLYDAENEICTKTI